MVNKTFSVRVKPEVAVALETAAKRDVRSIQSLLTKIIVEWLERNSK